MLPHLPSMTAVLVSAMRGVSRARGATEPLDPYAERVLPAPTGWMVARARTAMTTRAGRATLRWGSGGLLDHVALRTQAIDAALYEILATGISRVVIVGAGLDTRAARLPMMAACEVWEIDHPDTQRMKRRRAPLSHTSYLAVEFGVDDLGAALREAGLQDEVKTCWIWEGVTPYLTPEATHATLQALARCSAPGSHILMTYATDELLSLPSWLLRPVQLMFRLGGEPLQGLQPTETFHAQLTSVGIGIEHDTGSDDWRETHGGPTPVITIHERLVHGVFWPGEA